MLAGKEEEEKNKMVTFWATRVELDEQDVRQDCKGACSRAKVEQWQLVNDV